MVPVSAVRPAAVREPLQRGAGQCLGAGAHREEGGEGVAAFALGPEPGGGERRDRAGQAYPAHLEREQAAERVARHVRALDAERGAERPQGRGDGTQVVRDPVGQRLRDAEAGQIDGDHVVLGGQDVGHGVPGLEVVAYAVQQKKRFARALALVGDVGVARAQRRIDGERDRGGHAAPRRVDAYETGCQ